MKRFETIGGALLLTLTLAACGGGEEAADAPAVESEPAAETAMESTGGDMGEMMMPEWYTMDEAAMTVTLNIHATMDGGLWKFNGYNQGNATITVPEGYTVTINLINDDPAMAHSIGVDARTSDFPGSFTEPTPVFEGAITEDPTSMTAGTMPGETETITFTASTAGEYSLVCYIPAHAVSGMWVHFNVSADGEAGVQEMM